MPRSLLLILLLLFCLLPGSPSWADNVMHLEIFKLRNRPAMDLLPLVKPFLDTDGAIRGQDYKLFVKSTDANLEQISQMIAELDVRLKRLRIFISTDARSFNEQEKQQLQVHSGVGKSSDNPNVQKIVIRKGSQHEVTTRVYSTAQRRRQPAAQHVQLLEGQWASINSGYAIPIADRQRNADGTVTETIRYRKLSYGFKVRAYINGNKVYLTLRPKHEQLSSEGGGAISTQDIVTSLTVNLDQWTEIGGMQQRQKKSANGAYYSTRREQGNEQRMFIKVELMGKKNTD